MSGNELALDSNQIALILNGNREAEMRVSSASTLWIPAPVFAELWFGAINSAHPERNIRGLQEFADRCQILAITKSTAIVYAEVRLQLRRKGRPIPPNDIWIAALCLEHHLPLATDDAHFQHIDGLTLQHI